MLALKLGLRIATMQYAEYEGLIMLGQSGASSILACSLQALVLLSLTSFINPNSHRVIRCADPGREVFASRVECRCAAHALP